MTDHYSTLGVAKNASEAEIKKAYHNLAKKHHPDRNQGDKTSEAKFKEIQNAYSILKNKKLRQQYDTFGDQGVNQGSSHGGAQGGFSGFQGFSSGGNFEDIFDIFGDMMGSRRSRTRTNDKTGSDLQYSLNITLEESYSGITKKISFTSLVSCTDCSGKGSRSASGITTCAYCNGKGVVELRQGFFAIEKTCGSCNGAGQTIKDPCSACGGNGRVKGTTKLDVDIPAGISSGMKLRLTGKGEAGIQGSKSGDLYILINVQPHKIFQVSEADLYCNIPISVTTAMLGGKISIPVIDSDKHITTKVPAGAQHGAELCIRNRGMRKFKSSSRGDLHLKLEIKVPKTLTSEQKKLVQDLDASLQKHDAGFWSKIQNWWSS